MKNFTASLRTSSKYGLSKLCTPELNTFRRARLFLKNHANGFLRVVLFVPFIFFLGGVKKSQAQQNPLSPVQGFNIFAYGNTTLTNGDANGGLATFGNLTLNGAYSLSMSTTGSFKASGDANNTALIVEGNVSYSAGSGVNVLNGGFVKIKDFTTSKYWSTNPTRISAAGASSQDVNPRINLSASQTQASINADVFDFNTAIANMRSYSTTYKGCSSNTTVSTTATSYTFNLTSGRTNFFRMTASQLAIFNEIKFNIVPSATNPVVITVDIGSASSFNWNIPNFPGVPNAAGQYILFNFVNNSTGSATINLNGGSTIIGTVFAPNAHVNKAGSGNIEGQVVCMNYTHAQGEVHYQTFNTTVNCSSFSSVTCDCAGNMLINPSFELADDRAGYNSSNATKGWNWTGAPTAYLYTNTQYSVCDSYNAYLYSADNVPRTVWQQVNNITAGTSYSLSAYGGTHEPSKDHRIRLVFYSSTGSALLVVERQVDWDVDIVTSGPILQEYTMSGTAPTGTSYLRVEGYANGDYLKLDNFCLTINNTCNNLTSGGTIGSNQVLCKNVSSTPAALTNVTSPSGGDTGQTIQYQWYQATSLENGACPTNVAGSSKYTAISGATAATYTPGAITQTTCYIRTARRTNCNDYVAESNAVLVVLKNNCSTVACTNNIVTNSSFETDDNVTNNGKKFPVYFQSSPASYITRTATNTDAYRGASPADWAIGTDVNDYANQNGAYYIDASVTGNANSGDRFIYGRYNQCVLFAPSANQKFFPVTPGKKYKICAYMAAFNPSGVQGNADVYFEYNFRNAEGGDKGILSTGDIYQSVPADADGQWETLNWQQYCVEIVAPAGAKYLELYITPRDNEGDGIAIDDICMTEETCASAPVVSSANICGTGTATLTATGCTGGTVKWYSGSTDTTPIATGATYTPASRSTSLNLFATCTLNNCESMKTPVNLTVSGAVSGVSATAVGGNTSNCGTPITINGAGSVANPNLVYNGDFSAGDIGFVTQYGEQNYGYGVYGVTTDANTYFSWASACKDRTASGTGKILVADGATDASLTAWGQRIAVNPNTTYRLSTYATSISSTSPSTLAFYVNGVKVGTSTTLSATTCAWQQLTTTWNSGSSTTAYFEIRNENTNTGGNDFAIDDISMTVDAPVVTYSWAGPNSFSATTQNISASATGTYTLTVTGNTGCSSNASIAITINSTPSSPTTTPATRCGAGTVTLGATCGSGETAQWYSSQSSTTVLTTGASYSPSLTASTTYYVGCKNTTTSCETPTANRTAVTGTINTLPTAPSSSNVTNGAVCGSGVVNLSAVCSSGQTVQWYASQSSTSVLTTGTSYAPSITATTTYYVGCKDNTTTCETATNSRQAVVGTVNSIPSSPSAGNVSGGAVCGSGVVNLSATCSTGQTVQWYASQTSTTVLTTGTSYAPSIAATTTYYIGCKDNTTTCETAPNARQAVVGTVNPIPSAPSSGNVTNGAVCGSGVVNLTATCSSGQTVQWYASQTSTSVLTTGTSYAPSITATTTYYVACRDNTTNCETATGTRQGVIGTVNPIPSAPSANNVVGASRCEAGVVTLTATCSTGQTVQWYASQSSTSILTTGTSYAPSLTATTTYYVGCKDNTTTCTTIAGTRQSVVGTVNPNLPAPSSSNVTNGAVCGSGVVNLSAVCSSGQTVQWYASQTSTSVLTTGTSYAPSITATTTYYVGCKDNTTTCETATNSRQAVVGTVNPIPSSPSAGNVSGGAVCGSGVVNLSATCSTGQTVQWYASQTSTVVLSTGTSYAPSIAATTTYYVGCKDNTTTCETATNSRQSVLGTVNPIPSAPSSSNVTNGAVCGSGVVNLTATCSTGQTVQWYASQTSTSVLTTGTSYAPSITATTTYYVACRDNTTNCETATGTRQSVIGTVNPIPSAPSANNVVGASRCEAGVVTLTATCSTGQTVQWYASQSSTSVLTTGTSYSPSLTATTTYYVGCKDNTTTCETTSGTRQSVIGTVNPNLPAPSSSSVQGGAVCGSGVVNLSAVCSSGQTVQWYASQTSTSVLTIGTSYAPSITATTTYFVGCKDNTTTCETATNSRQAVVGTVNPIPSSPSAGNVSGGAVCGSGVVNLTATCSTGQTVQWYASQTSTTVLTTGTSYAPSIAATTTYYVGCKDNTTTCETATNSRQSVVGTVNPIPSAPSSGNVTNGAVCGSGVVNLSATCSSGQTVQWYASQSSTSVLTTGTSYAPSITATTTYYVACRDNTTNCETATGTRQGVIGTVNPIPSAPSSSNVVGASRCEAGVVTLTATCSTGQTVQWYASQSSTSVLTTGTSYSPSLTATTTYYVGCKDNTTTCETTSGTRQSVVGTVNPNLPAPSSSNVTNGAVCGSGVVNLSAVCSSGQTVQWYASQSSTSVLTTGTSYAPSITATTTYYVGCKDNTTTCETATNSRQAVVGTVNPIPSSPSAGNVSGGAVCGSGVVNLSATCSTGQTVQWYASQTSTVVLSTGTSYAPSIAATTTYYVGCKDNTTTCETATNSRQAVVGTVNPIPSAPSSGNVTNGAVCGSGVVNLSATCTTGQTVQWYASQTSTSVLTTGTSYAPSISATTTYYVACRDNTTNCETVTGTRQAVIGTVNPIPSAPSSSNVVGASRCEAGVVTLTATCSTGQTVQWYASQSSTSVLTTGTSYSPSLTATTTYYVGCKDNTTTCETTSGTRQSVVGTVNPNLPAPSSSSVQGGAVCGSGVVNLSAVCSSGQTVQWYASQTSTSVLTTGTSYAPSITATTTYYVGCKDNTTTCETATNSRQAVIGTVNPIPSSPSAGNVSGGAVCGSGVVNLSATCLTGQTVQWYASQTSTTVLTTGTSYAPSIAATTTYYVGCKDNTTTCETATNSRQAVVGTVNPIPSAPSSGNVTNGAVCGSGVVNLTATCSTGQTVQWYASQTSTSVLTTGTSYAPSITATTTYYVVCKDNTTNCETTTGTRQGVIGTVNPIPSAPSANNVVGASRCEAGVVTLTATCSTGQTVQWYASQSSTSVLTTGTSYSPSLTATTTYYVGCKDNTTTCETTSGTRQSVVGTVNPNLPAPSSSNVTNGAVCGSGVVNLSAVCSSGQTVQWYASQSSTSVLTTGTSYAPSITATTTYYVGCKDNTTTCETATNSRQAVVGTVNPIPSSPSAGNVSGGTVCGSGVVNLTATCSTGQTVQWYASQTSTVVLSTGTSYAPSIAATTTYYVGCKDNTTTCETATNSRQSVVGTVNPIPSAPSSGNVTNGAVCGSGVVNLTATCSSGQTVQWYASQTSTSVLTTGTSYAPSITATTTYFVGCKDNTTTCETATGTRQSVIGTVNPIPSAPSSSNVVGASRCEAGVVTLTATCSTGQTVQWYASQSSTSVLTTGTSYSPSLIATTTYYVGCKDNTTTCTTIAGTRQSVVGTVNPNLPAPSSSNVTNGAVCGSGVVNLSAVCSSGQTVQWYASQSSTSVLTTGTSYAPSITATTTYYVGCKDNTTTCETATNSRQAVVGTVNPIPSSPSAGNVSGGAVCGSGVVNLSATCSTGQTVQWYASQTSTVVLSTGTSYAPSISATTTYYVGCKDNTTTCETAPNARQSVVGTVNPIPSAPSSSNVTNGAVCGSGVVNLSATCSSGQTVQWYASQSSTSVLTTGTSYAPSITATTTYYVACRDNTTNCETTTGTRQGVIGTVNPIPSAPSSSNVVGASRCEAGVVTLTATCSTGQTVQWYASQTSTSVLTTGTSYSPSLTATTTYYVGCKDNTTTCETTSGTRQSVVGTVNPNLPAPSSSSVQGGAVCGSGVVNLSAVCSSGQTVQWYASQSSTSVLTTGTSYAPSITATTTYYVGCKDNTTTCETATNSRQAVIGTVNPIPSSPSAGNVSGGAVCGSGVVNLSATCSTGQTVQWYASQTSTVVLSTGTSYAPSIAATTTYYVGCKDNTTTCETATNSRQAVVGTVNPIPSAPSSSNVTNGAVCGSGVVNLSATCSTGQTVQWYASQTSTSVLTTGTSYAPSITATTTYYVACRDNTTNCETATGTRQSVIGTVNPIPSAPSANNVVGASRCEAGVVTLTATCSTGQTVQWYASQSSTSVLTTGTSYSPSLTATTTYYVGCKDNTTTCETTSGTRQSVVGTVNPNLPAPSSSNVTNGAVCGSGVVNLSAVCSSGQTVQWYASQTSTSVLTTGTSYAPSITATTTYYVGCKDNTTTCETATNSRQAVVGTVNSIPSSPSAGNVSGGAVCGSGVVNLSATCSTGQTVQWYASQTSTTVLTTGTSYAPSIAATTTYYIGCKDNTTTCETAPNARQAVVGTVNPIPSAPSSGNVTNGAVCGSGVVNLTATCSTGQTVQWYASQTSTSVLTTGTSYAPSITATTTYYVACRDNTTNCETATGTRQSVIGTVNPIPSAPSANNVVGASRCEAGVVTLTATCSTGQTVQWYASQSSTSVLTTGTSYSPSLTATTTYYVGCKDNTTTCTTTAGTRQSVVGTVNPNLPAPSSSSVQGGAVCGSGVVNLSAVCSSGQTVQWYASQSSTSVLTTGTSYAPSITATTTYYVGCKDNTTTCETATNSRQAVVGTVNPIPSSPSAGNVSGGAVCGSGVVNLTATCSTGQTVQWYASQTSTVVLSTGTSYAPSIAATTTYYVGCKDNTTTCETAPNARQSVVGTVNPIPSAPSSGNVTNGAVCGSGVVNLTATCSTGQTVQWYASQTSTSVLTTGTSYAPSITATTTYYVACRDNTTNCETATGTRQAVIGTVNPIPSAPSANNVVGASRCEAGVVTLTATCSTGQTVQWYASQSSTSVLTTGTSYSPSLTATTTYYVGCKDNTTTCETTSGTRQSVVGTVNPNLPAPSSSNVTNGAVCGSGVVNLSAVCSSGQTVQWYASQSSTSVLTTGTSYAPSITATTTYYVGCKDNTTTCETATNSRQAVVGTVNSIPSSPSAGNVSGGAVCGSGVVNLTATCSTGQTVQWYASQTSTVVLSTGTSYAPSIAATTTYYVGCKDNTTTCETATNSRQSVVGTVNPIPSAPSSSNVTNGAVCGSGVVNLTATCTTGQTVQWYASQTSTSVLTTGTSYAPSITATTTYYVACRDNTTNCETATGTRQSVIGTVNPIPSAPSSSNVVGASRCEAGVVTLTATCSTGQTVQWYASQSSTSVLTTGTSYSPSLTATTTYYVGCKDNTTTCETTSGTRQSVVGTVNPNLPAPSSSSVQGGAVCGSGVVNLSAVCSSGQTVQWYASQSSTSVLTTGTSYAPSITATTTYYVGCKDNTTTCETATNSRQAVVGTVNPIPPAPSPSNVTNNSRCGSGVLTLGATCGAGETVQWYASQTSTTVLSTGTSYSPSLSATTSYYVACKNNTTLCEVAIGGRTPVVGTVNLIPDAPASADVQGGSVCGTGNLTLTANCRDASLTPVWYSSQSSTTMLTSGNAYTVAVSANATYFVSCKNTTTSCETPVGSRRSVDVIYNSKPTPVATTNSPVCIGGTVTLSTSGGTSYLWEGPNGYSSTSATPSLTNASTSLNGIYTVTVSGTGGCTGTATVEVVVRTKPTVTASVTDATVCNNSTIELKANGTAASGATIASYTWSGPSSFASTSQNPTISGAQEANEGFYNVKATDSFGCTATSEIFVFVNPVPTATASSEGGTIICQGAPISLYGNGGGIGGSYSWAGPAGYSSTIQNPTIPISSPTYAGVYTLTVTDANGCTAATTISISLDKCLKLGDLVWDDLNNNGIKDAGESGISNVTVKLYRDANNDNVPDGVAIATQVTTSTGNYLFTGLEPDNYIVGIIAPAGYISSTGKNGSATGPYEGSATPDPDNDVNNDDNGTLVGAEIITKAITLVPYTEPVNDGDTDNTSNLTVDFGLFKPSKIGDLVWYDTNRDGIQNETPLNGVNNVTVTLTDGLGNILATTTTNSSGIYGFDYLGLGDYKVVFSTSTLPAGYVISTKDAGGDDTKDSDADLTGTTGVVSITVPGTSNLTVDAGVNCPAAQISVSTDKNTYCAGSTVKLTTVVTGTPTVSQYSWSGPASFTSTSQSPTINGVATAQSGVYTLTVTANNACSATTTATVNVVVNALPTVSATLVNTVVCQGQTIELKANGSGSNYSWSGPSSFTSTQQNPTIASATTANSGTYTVVVSDGNICSASTTVQVTVNTLPVLTATGGTICQGQSLNLGVTGASTYSWTGPNGFTATGASPSVNTQGVYTVTGTNAIGCIGTATASVTVNPAATISVSNVEVCVGGVAQLTATGASTYSWTGPNGFTSTSAQALISNSAAITMNGVYTVVGTTSLGCVGSATASLTVKENPVVTISGNRVICPGGQVALTANSSGTFAWTGPNGFTANTAVINVSTAGSYQVVVTNNGCSATGTVTLTTETFNVNASASATTVCSGGSVNLNVNATVGSGVKSYSWSGPAGFTATTTNPVLSNVSVSNSGTYTVTVEGNSGCTTTATVSITVSPIPTTNKAIEFCEGSTTTLAVTGFTNATYSWNTSATTSSISVSTAGAYTVNITEANGCKSVQVFNVTQNPKAATVVTGATAFCSDASTQLTINSGVTSGQTYLWTGPNGFSSTSQTVSITQEGTYTVKVITDKNCEATTTVAVTKNTVNATATSVSACAGSSITLGASGGTSYSWAGPNGFTSTAQNPVVSGASALSQGIYMVTVSANGCVATATTDVMVYAKPNFVPIVTNSECNKTTTLNNGSIRIAGFNTGDKYDIVEASTYTGTKNFATATVIPTNGILMANIPNPTATKTYTIRVFNANGCFTDQVVRIQPVACDCGPQECVPITIQKSAR